MEALIYDESPLATYLEGDAIPHEKTSSEARSTTPQYAPRGFPKLREHLRVFHRTAKSVTDVVDQDFLERFRYIIIASQLLSDDSKPRAHKLDDDPFAPTNFTPTGAYVTAGVSFSIAWLLNWLRRRANTLAPITWVETCTYLLLVTGVAVSLVFVARRQYLKFVRRSAAVGLSELVTQSHNFDSAASTALRYIQEVEVVARGYGLSHPLPPVSRLDDKIASQQCRHLRSAVANHLRSSIAQFTHAHKSVLLWLNVDDLDTYYHIYEISVQEYTEAAKLADTIATEAQTSLKDLRFLFGLHVMARKLFLVDLLALRAKATLSDILQWRSISQHIQSLWEDTRRASEGLEYTLAREEFLETDQEDMKEKADSNTGTQEAQPTPEKQHAKAQMRRFEAVANGIRSLNAKVRLLREEVTGLIATNSPETEITSFLTKHYEHLGTELRGLLVEWERGRNTMFLHVDMDSKFSRPSSSTMSPSPSLGGLTMVDGGPAEALRLLTGEEDSRGFTETTGFDEEVFEAVAQPRKRMSLAFTREEKMAKLQEDRRKRATLQEQSDTTTNMLRELQMVIKHRPEARPTNRIMSV